MIVIDASFTTWNFMRHTFKMLKLQFVDDLPQNGLRRQYCRSHAAKVSHHQRRQKLGNAIGPSSLVSTHSRTKPRRSKLDGHSKDETCDHKACSRKATSPTLMQPRLLVYLRDTYGAAQERHISTLFDFRTLHETNLVSKLCKLTIISYVVLC